MPIIFDSILPKWNYRTVPQNIWLSKLFNFHSLTVKTKINPCRQFYFLPDQQLLLRLRRGVAIFTKAFLGIPAQQVAKIRRPLMPAAAPAVLSLSFATQQEDSSHHPNDSRRFRKACISTTQITLRENTCTIASGDYSTSCLAADAKCALSASGSPWRVWISEVLVFSRHYRN